MEYRKNKDSFYLRIDKDEKVVETIKELCRREKIQAGYFQGIGACGTAVISTHIPEKEDFIDHSISGMIEMISLLGNISTEDDDQPFLHCHAVFSYLKDDGEIAVTAGHLKEAVISYTGEIVISAAEEKIGRTFDPRAGIDVWRF